MNKLWSIIILLATFIVPSFAQLTPSDSTITNNGGAGITTSVVLDKNKVYLLQGFVYVRSGGKLTIPAGTIILGETASQGSLIIERGGQIFANGTATEPIVFTSQQPSGSRGRGDWGGIVICGKAANNRPGGNFVVEGNIGSVAGYGDNGIVQDDHDNSGVLRYVRIEFPGIAYTPNNEINGLTLAAVGDATVVEHVQVSYSGDDSFEFFGGTVNCKYLIAYKAYDDDFDTDFGYTGKIQFGVVYRDPNLADVSKSEAFETDNDGSGTSALPRTAPIISNITAIGPKRASTDVATTNFHTDFYYGIHHRRATRHNLFNSVITGFDEGGILFDGTTVLSDTSNFTYKNNTWAGHTIWVGVSTGSAAPYEAYLSSKGNIALTEPNDVLLKAPFNQTSPVLVPQAGSSLLGTADFTDAKLSDPFFTAVSYRGAFSGNGAERWDLGWANYDPQAISYGAAGINLKWTSVIYLTSGNGASRSVIIGRGNGATDGIDIAFGESNVPTPPPAGIVDLRSDLGSGNFSYIDIRSSASTSSVITYTLKPQAGNPSGSVQMLNWDPNYLGAGKFTLKSSPSGIFPDLDMKTASSQDITSLIAGGGSVLIEVDTKFSQAMVVQSVWNLVSFPGNHPNSMSIDTLYRGRDLSWNVFKYTQGVGYESVSLLETGRGYWMNHTNVRTYNWNGTVQSGILYPKLDYSERKPFAANSGWVMIGGYEYNAATNFLRTNPENKKAASSVFKYVPGTGYVSTTVMEPGLGYWVEVTAACNIYIPGPFTGTLAKDPITELISSAKGKIIITDAAGQSNVLYVADASVDLNRFNLPPIPPANLFDVRFGSQRFGENLSSAQTINLNGVVYPVTIKAEGINITLADAITGTAIKAAQNNSLFVIENKNTSLLKVQSDEVIPNEYSLEQNYPNPFNPMTLIRFSLPEQSDVTLTIYNALGQKVTEVVNMTLDAGSHSYKWDASSVASGLYFYELKTKNFSSIKKMMLMK
ncbi:MAG: T9SS type A sorting domain-containing protein [Ignavibacteriaceae bacterium]|nr:T9SS type A sorting domain-containing protein [Ignavibacteriaceae bacterium]